MIVVSFWNHFFLPSGIAHRSTKAQGSCVVNGWLSQGLGDSHYHLWLTRCVNTLFRRRSWCNFRNGTYRDGARAGGPFASLAVNLRKVSELNACSGRVASQGPLPTILDGTPLRDSLGRAIEEMIKPPQQPPSVLLFTTAITIVNTLLLQQEPPLRRLLTGPGVCWCLSSLPRGSLFSLLCHKFTNFTMDAL